MVPEESLPPNPTNIIPPDPSISPPPQFNQPLRSKKRFHFPNFFHNKKVTLIAFMLLFAVVGGTAIYFAFANNNYGVSYYWVKQRFHEDYWDGQTHTSRATCIAKSFVCHANGKLIILGPTTRVWESDPAKNSLTNLQSPAWYGPYTYSPGPYYAYGFGITGRQKVCFRVKDVSTSVPAARVVFQVVNEAVGSTPAKVLITVDGTLGPAYKKGRTLVCITYNNPKDALKQSYRAYVRKGKIQMDYVEQQWEYFIYDYNPYPYNMAIASVRAKSGAAQKRLIPTVCSAELKKTTAQCDSKNDLSAANIQRSLTNVLINPNVTYGE